MDSIYLNVVGPYRIRMYRKEERNSDFFHSSMPGIHSVSLYFGRVGIRFLTLFPFSPRRAEEEDYRFELLPFENLPVWTMVGVFVTGVRSLFEARTKNACFLV